MNSIMILPEKTTYLISEVKIDLVKQILDQTTAYKGEIKELKDYINTLHAEVQIGLTKIKKISQDIQMTPGSNKMFCDLSLEVESIKKFIDS